MAIFPRLPQNAALEDYTLRVAEAWKPGLKKSDNGAILFIFVEDHRMRIEVGYGLEGALPDSLAKRITSEQIVPRFRNGDYDGGVLAGVQGILQATRGEYKGTGRTPGGKNQSGNFVFLLFFGAFLLIFIMGRRRGRVYGGRGAYWGGGWYGGGGGWSGGSSAEAAASVGGGSFGGEVPATVGNARMNPKDFITRLDENRIVAAIAAAEKRTSGELRVWVSEKERPDALSRT